MHWPMLVRCIAQHVTTANVQRIVFVLSMWEHLSEYWTCNWALGQAAKCLGIYIYIHMSSWLKCKTRWLCYLYWLLLASTHWSLSRSFARPAYSMCGLLFATFSCQHFRSSWLFWLSTRVWQSFTVRLWQRSPVVPMALTIFDVYFSIPNQSSLHWHAQQ